MGVKTRYLQLSFTTMLEYNIESNARKEFNGNTFGYVYTKLRDGHYCIMSPCSYETTYNDFFDAYDKIDREHVVSINTLNHFAVPTTEKMSEWFTFMDPDYTYAASGNYTALDNTDNKVKSYLPFCTNPITGEQGFYYGEVDGADAPGFDTVKLYFSSGYDFTDIYGALMKLYVERNDGTFLDFCNFFYTRSNIYKYIKYMAKPIIFGNVIYDKYLELDIISMSGLDDCPSLKSELNIKENAPIKMMFSYIEDQNVDIRDVEFVSSRLVHSDSDVLMPNTGCYFTRSSTLRGTIPTEKLNSDNLGVYIASTPSMPYIEFYGTWKDQPLTTDTVQKFNVDIKLYDKSLIKRGEVTYEVEDEYSAGYNMRKWVANHEIECAIVDTNNEIVKTETYTVSQIFIGDPNENTKFYYRPIIFDDFTTLKIGTGDVAMVITYNLRFMNIEDSVQLLKSGSLTLSGNELMKFCGKTTTLGFSDKMPYKVYNKVIEQKQVLGNSALSNGIKTKYIKSFYNTTNISLDINGVAANNGAYTLKLSRAPKCYKFIVKEADINGNLNYMDLTDCYYKLYTHDASGNEVIIEPTYSKNMNLLLGELEFALSPNVLNKLKEVAESQRDMSIVAYNTDNSVSSMFDMKFTF